MLWNAQLHTGKQSIDDCNEQTALAGIQSMQYCNSQMTPAHILGATARLQFHSIESEMGDAHPC